MTPLPILILLFCLILPSPAIAMFEEVKNEKRDSTSDPYYKKREDSTYAEQKKVTQEIVGQVPQEIIIQSTSDEDNTSEKKQNLTAKQEAMEPAFSIRQKLFFEPERLSTSLRETRAPSTLYLVETTPTKPPFLAELQEQLSRKKSSPDSITTRAISLEGERAAFLPAPTRRVTFADLPHSPEGKEAILEPVFRVAAADEGEGASGAERKNTDALRPWGRLPSGSSKGETRGNERVDVFNALDGASTRMTQSFAAAIDSEDRFLNKPTVAFRIPLLAEEKNNKQLNQSIRRLKGLTTGLEVAVDEIPEEDPQRVTKIASIYRQAYPRFEAHLDFLLKAIDEESILKDQRCLLHLGNSAIQLLEVAFNAIDRSTMEPVEIETPFEHLDLQNPFVTRNFPYSLIPIGVKKIEPHTRELEEMIRIADNTIYSLQSFIKVLRASDENVGRLFCEARAEKISREMNIILGKICNLNSIISAISSEDEEALKKVRKTLEKTYGDYDIYSLNYDKVSNAQEVHEITITESREGAFFELYQSSRESIKIGQQLMNAFRS